MVLDHTYQPIIDAYDHAIEMHLLDSVETYSGGDNKSYASTNYKEYFAELTESFWGRNDFYPFTRDQLM